MDSQALEIRDGAVDAMIALYKHAMSTRRLDGYITSDGEVSLPRAEVSYI